MGASSEVEASSAIVIWRCVSKVPRVLSNEYEFEEQSLENEDKWVLVDEVIENKEVFAATHTPWKNSA